MRKKGLCLFLMFSITKLYGTIMGRSEVAIKKVSEQLGESGVLCMNTSLHRVFTERLSALFLPHVDKCLSSVSKIKNKGKTSLKVLS